MKCSVAECQRASRAKGMCDTHYRQVKNSGKLNRLGLTGHNIYPPAEQRLWAKVRKTESCWHWTGAQSAATGHGNFKVNGKVTLVHRFSYELAKGPIPEGLVIDHICRNGSCVNPDHLRAVTQKQNMENRGGAHANSKSGVRGVHMDRAGAWVATVGHRGRKIRAGRFYTIEEATAAVVKKRNELFTCNDADRTMEEV